MPDLPRAFLDVPIAHRALHDKERARPENSCAAIRAAIASGYGIEIDIQRSRDDVPIVFHDYTLERLTAASGAVAAFDADALGNISLSGGGESIPTLSEVLDLVSGAVPLLVEIKDQDGAMGPSVGPLEGAIAQILQGYEGAVAVMSFNPHSVREMARLVPQVPRGLVTSSFSALYGDLPEARRLQLREISDYAVLGCSFISHEHRDLNRPRVSELKTQGARILCWTVKSAAEEKEARKIADNITFEQYLPPFPA